MRRDRWITRSLCTWHRAAPSRNGRALVGLHRTYCRRMKSNPRRRMLDPLIFEQEYLGKFVIARGRAFADFDPAIHVAPTAYDPSLQLCWSLDFNIDPMCSGIIQHDRGRVRVIGELSLADTDTDSACDAFLEVADRRGWDLRNVVDLWRRHGMVRATAPAGNRIGSSFSAGCTTFRPGTKCRGAIRRSRTRSTRSGRFFARPTG